MTRDDDADLEKDISRQENIVEMETLKLIGLYTQRDMRKYRTAQTLAEPR